MGTRDLTAYSPRLLLQWQEDAPAVTHRAAEGTLVFADVSGFTRLSERLARASGRAGAEQMGDIINALFDDLLTCAALRGGEMLKYGGDAALLFYRGDDHALRAVAGAHDMQARLREIGRVETGAGPVRLRMSVGMHTGTFDLFKVGGRHQELIVAGPATTETVRMEAAADAGEILLSSATAAAIAPRNVGAEKDGGRLLRGTPAAPTVDIVLSVPSPHADRFVAPSLGAYLAGDVDPDHRLATVAFVHMMGIDRLLSEVGADAVATRLDETLTVVQSSLEEYGVSFLATDVGADGAKVMAASGAPLAGDDDERRMLLALRRMLDAATPLPLRAGVNRGHVFAASVGPHFRRTFTTIGDVTNTAARLQAKAGSGEVLTVAAVLDHVHSPVDAVELSPFAAKGKAEPLVPMRVDAVHDTSTASDAEVPRLPLTGRDLELDTLLRAAESVSAGTGALVELVGDMGSGKSRLVEELLTLAAGLRPLVVRCEPYERATPFHPIKRLLTQLVPTDPRELASLVADRAPSLVPWLPLVAAVLDVPLADTDETRVLDPRFRLARTAAVTAELLRSLLNEPSLLVVEDIHWLDDASAAVLREIESHVSETSLLVCATCRNEPSTFVPSGASALVQLAPLGDLAMASLVTVATADAPLPPHVRDALVERAAGNPLFLTELLDHGVDAGALPESVEAVMAAQIDRLPPAERRLLRHAAVLGSRFGTTLLAEISDEPELTGTSARAVAARLRWLVVPEGRGMLRFRHQLVRDVAYESLPFRVRRELHGRAGDALQRTAADEHAGVLSLHFLRANRHQECWTYARRAAARACEKHANVEAVELLDRALSTIRHLEHVDDREITSTWRELAIRRIFLGDSEQAKDALRNARRWARTDAVETASLCRDEARLRERDGDIVALMRWIRRGVRAIDGRADRDARAIRAELLVLHAWAKQQQGRALLARRLALQGLAEAEASGNDQALAGALLALDGSDVALGAPPDPDRAQRAIAIYESLGRLEDVAMVLINLGSYANQRSEWSTALALNARGRDLLKRTGNFAEAAYGSFNMAEVLIDQGHVDEARAIVDELRSLWRAVDHTLGLAYLDGLAGRLAARCGDHREAIEALRRAEESLAHHGLNAYAVEMAGRCAESMLAVGDIEDAIAKVEDAIARAAQLGDTHAMPPLLRVRAVCLAASGHVTAATNELADCLTLARQRGATHDIVLALHAATAIDPLRTEALRAERDDLAAMLGIVELPAVPLASGDDIALSV